MNKYIFAIGSVSIMVSCTNPKINGNGEHFYTHIENGKTTYHSTKECDLIGNAYDIDNFNPTGEYDFCSKCMDDSLIVMCKQSIEQEFEGIKSPNELMADEIVSIETLKVNGGEIDAQITNISPYTIKHGILIITFGGSSRFEQVRDLKSGDDARVRFNIPSAAKAFKISLFRVTFEGCETRIIER